MRGMDVAALAADRAGKRADPFQMKIGALSRPTIAGAAVKAVSGEDLVAAHFTPPRERRARLILRRATGRRGERLGRWRGEGPLPAASFLRFRALPYIPLLLPISPQSPSSVPGHRRGIWPRRS